MAHKGRSTTMVDPAHRWVLVVVWGLAILFFLVYSLWLPPLEIIRTSFGLKADPDKQSLLWLIFQHGLLIAPIGVVLLIVAGQLGRGLGLPGLFRDPPPLDLEHERQLRGSPDYLTRSRGRAAAFWGAVGATLLVGQVWTVIFYLELVENLDLFDLSHIDHPWLKQHHALLLFQLICGMPFLVLLFLAELVPAQALGIERRGKDFAVEVGRFVAGVLVGMLTIFAGAKLGAWLHGPQVAGLCNWLHGPQVAGLCKRFISPFLSWLVVQHLHPKSRDTAKLMTSFGAFTLITLAYYVLLAGLFRRSLSPGLGICMILSVGIAFYSVLAMLVPAGQIILLVLVLLGFVWTNGDPYKYRFPGMGDYYQRCKRVKIKDIKDLIFISNAEAGLLPNEEVLNNWRAATGQEKPKLVLIATTGGAYRAAFWTTVVLEELSRPTCLGEDFPRHIRLFTGASGGMVGAAYYVAAMEEPGAPPQDNRGATALLRGQSGLDSLTPVVRRLVSRDLPRAFWPYPQDHDRGIELEQQWKTLAKTFPELSDGERAGWRPSLIVSPMVIESCRRLLISNLDLYELTVANVANKYDPDVVPTRAYSRPAVEFFRVFPKARQTFSLQTAVRMSATFPLASPAISLPTYPPRRVVDAGYYDNYGVDLATLWAYMYQDWIRDNTSGVALIQIRAYPSEDATMSYLGLIDEEDHKLPARIIGRLKASFQSLTSPLEGGFSARDWTTRFRNANQVRFLDDLLNLGKEPRFFESFVFENFAEFAMNWFISDHNIEEMRHSISAESDTSCSSPDRIVSRMQQEVANKNHVARGQLVDWWTAPPPEQKTGQKGRL